MASHSHLQIFAPPQDWKTMALNPLMLDNAYSNSALVITPKLNLRQTSSVERRGSARPVNLSSQK